MGQAREDLGAGGEKDTQQDDPVDGKDTPSSGLDRPSGPVGPPPGSWAATARIMAQGDDSGFDWDRWKDEMKEKDLEEKNQEDRKEEGKEETPREGSSPPVQTTEETGQTSS